MTLCVHTGLPTPDSVLKSKWLMQYGVLKVHGGMYVEYAGFMSAAIAGSTATLGVPTDTKSIQRARPYEDFFFQRSIAEGHVALEPGSIENAIFDFRRDAIVEEKTKPIIVAELIFQDVVKGNKISIVIYVNYEDNIEEITVRCSAVRDTARTCENVYLATEVVEFNFDYFENFNEMLHTVGKLCLEAKEKLESL